jgi:hypothetical protein
MSVPLDRLYNHLDGLCNHDALIYRFYPHGSKKLTDLLPLYNFSQRGWQYQLKTPSMLCHDQEPLMFDQYSDHDMLNYFVNHEPAIFDDTKAVNRIKTLINTQHLRSVISARYGIYDTTLLLHSEKHSENLAKYEQAGFIGVYWWAHAAIASDWYRYAEHDPGLAVNFNNIRKDFLVYNRAWSGTREYRLKFAELVINANLQPNCCMSFSQTCDDQHYTMFDFKNSKLAISRCDLETYFEPCTVDATASADYHTTDYAHTGIEIVLETLFDDTRWHLTEKSLRPIACGRPFMLAGTPGSLEYLRSYGFETFGDLIDESYDQIVDPGERLQCITTEMLRISKLPHNQKLQLWQSLYEIANRNKQLFFSEAWQQQIFDEFVSNFNQSISTMEQHKTGRHWLNFRDAWTACPEQFKHVDSVILKSMAHQEEIEQLFNQP